MSTSKWKPYPNYKSSKSPVGTLPTSWEEIRFRLLFGTQKGKIPSLIHSEPLPDSIPYVSMEYLREGTISQHVTPGKGSVIVEEDDMIILWDGSNAGEILKSKFGILSSTAAKILPKNDECRDFDFFCLKSLEPIIKSGNTGMGIPHVGGDFLKEVRLPRPSLNERQKIVKFLNYRTDAINSAITRLNQKLLLLEEKRTAFMTQLVARGLDPDVPMKDSGNEWLGEIPLGWTSTKLSRFAQVITKGTTPSAYGKEFQDSGINFVKVESISHDYSLLPEMFAFIDEETHQIQKRSQLQENDVLFSIAGAIGRIGLVDAGSLPANTNQAVGIIRPKTETVLPEWMAYALDSGPSVEQWSLTQVQSAQANLSLESLGNICIPIPQIDEQRAIIQHIQRVRSVFSNLSYSINKKIRLLNEYRISLISAAVTGKIDVREMEV